MKRIKGEEQEKGFNEDAEVTKIGIYPVDYFVLTEPCQ